MAVLIILATLIFFFMVYFLFAKRVERSLVYPNDKRTSPSRRYYDGKDFIPTKPLVAYGYHFKSIGLDPIIGPVIAMQFGWLPALIWVAFGVLFMGWVQNYLTTIISMRNKGANLASLAGILFTPRSCKALLAFIYIYMLLIMCGLASIMTPLMARENVPVGFLSLILAGIIAGQMISGWRIPVLLATFLSLLIAVAGIYLGATPASMSVIRWINQLGSLFAGGVIFTRPLGYGELNWVTFFWISVIMVFCYFSAIKPMWRISQPVNYIASWFIILGMVGAIVGIFLSSYRGDLAFSFELPALIATSQPNLGPLWPILFVTISCGAISGWHALVSTFSTSRQIEKETQVLPVTAGASFTQSILVIMGIIFAASLGVSASRFNPDLNYQLVAGPAGVFANGMTHFLNIVGLPLDLGDAVSAVFVTVMALTVLPLVLRFMRITGAELIGDSIPAMKNPQIGALVAVLLTLAMIFLGFWQWIWVIFAAANLMLAAIALLLIAAWIAKQGKKFNWILFPALFLFGTSLSALVYVSIYKAFYLGILSVGEQSPGLTIGYLLTSIVGLILMILSLNLLWDGHKSIFKYRSRNVGASLVIYDRSL
jgi:carbon starvation protein